MENDFTKPVRSGILVMFSIGYNQRMEKEVAITFLQLFTTTRQRSKLTAIHAVLFCPRASLYLEAKYLRI